MRMRNKLIVIWTLVCIAAIIALYVSSQLILLQSYANLEDQSAQRSIQRTLTGLSNEFEELSSKVGDYAEWDDTYQFIQDADEAYVQNNFPDSSTLSNLRVDVVIFIDSQGQVIFDSAVQQDLTTSRVPADLLEYVSTHDSLWNYSNPDSKITGVVSTTLNPVLIASRPILTSQHGGPIQGALIMGRYLDSDEVDYLAQTVLFPLSVSRFSDFQSNADAHAASSLSKETPVFVQPLSDSSVAGYGLIMDVQGNPALVLKIEMPREIYQQGQASIAYFILSFVATSIITGVVAVLVVDKQMLSQVDKLAIDVRTIAKSNDASQRLSWKRTDELAILANAIDSMMEQRLSTIQELAAMVGHDLRNPLTGIASAAYYLKSKIKPENGTKIQEMFEIIDKDIEYSNKIINDLLEYSRKIKLDLIETNLKTLLKESLALVNVPSNIQVFDLTENSQKLKVDIYKTKRVFANLLKNSIEAMPEGGGLTIKNKSGNGKIKIAFSDTGPGIPKETLEKLFTPLFTTKAKGMGLGLAICKRFVEVHGGTITAESTLGKGTTFTVTFPANSAFEEKDNRSE